MEAVTDAEGRPFGSFMPDLLTKALLGWNGAEKPGRPGKLRRKLAALWLGRSRAVLDQTFWGLRLRLQPATNSSDMSIVIDGIHQEEDEFSRVAALVADYENFVDIGANIGLYSMIAAMNMPHGRPILAFEPIPETARRMRVNLALNDINRVEVIEAAVGDVDGVLLLNRSENNIGSTSAVIARGGSEQVTVRCLRLPEFLAARGISRIGMLKMDIEGFEDRALMPAIECMPPEAWPRYILMEVKHSRHWKGDMVSDLLAKGYREVFRNSRNIHLMYERAVS